MGVVFRFLLRYARRNVPSYAFGGLFLVATNYAAVRIPALIGAALNALRDEGGGSLTARSTALELGLWGLGLIVVRTLSRVLFFNPARDAEHRIRVELFRHLLTLHRPFFSARKVGDLVSLGTNDTMSARLLLGFAGLQVCNVIVAIPMHLFQMISTDATLAMWCLGPVLLGAIYMQHTVRRFFGLIRESMGLLGKLSDRVLESFAGIRTVRLHGAEDALQARFDERNNEYLNLQLRIAGLRAFAMPALMFSGMAGAAIVLWVGGERVVAGQMKVGDLATFTALLLSLVSVLTSLAWVLAAVSRGLVAVGRLHEVFGTTPDLPPSEGPWAAERAVALEVRDLTFRYGDDEPPVLSDVSFSVEPGKTLGIFGATGAGKSTLLDVLTRVNEPPPGTVWIDGRDARGIPLGDLRAAMAVVPQTPFLFSTSLRHNIALTDAPEQDKLAVVVERAALTHDITQLPDGLDTVVGERGVMLSGGQRQRAALARALYRCAPIVVLDDVLSAVDQNTEAELVRVLRTLGGDRTGQPTTVLVSHRTSSLEHADEIVVLAEGRVIERGTHSELLARGGHYAETHLHQTQEQQGRAADGA